MESKITPMGPLRLKIEINTREHFTVFGAASRTFSVKSPWFSGQAEVGTYALDELLATKLRTLYQRRKGRDLFDLWIGIEKMGADPRRIATTFRKHMDAEGNKVTKRMFEINFAEKIGHRQFGMI